MKRIFVLCFVCLTFFSCSNERTVESFETQFTDNRQEFEIIASQFLNQGKIAGLTMSYGDKQCTELNSWRRCPEIKDEWEMWSSKEDKFIQVPDFRSVLMNEGITNESYQYFASFLESQKLQSLRKLPGGWVEFDDEKMGLRFNSSPNVSFPDGLKFSNVRQLNANWFLYEKKEG